MSDTLRASAFHARTAAFNRSNAWVACNGVTLSAIYTDTNGEALAARTRVATNDLSARWQLMLDGPRTVEFLQHLLTRDVNALSPAAGFKALWLADGGGVRGAAAIARFGKESFWLLSASCDAAWISAAAALFDVAVRDVSAERSGLAIVGPYARPTLEAAGVQAELDPLAFRKVSWLGLEIILSRFGEHGGYELWCHPDDGIIVWDRIMKAGNSFGIEPVGTAAMNVLDIEAGIPRPHRDYIPATDNYAATPLPRSLGLELLVDPEHREFNGRKEFLNAAEQQAQRLIGVQIDSDRAAPYMALSADGRLVGHTLSSCYSPCLRRAIALAEIVDEAAIPGSSLSLTLPPSLQSPKHCVVPATVARLPFLEQPDPFPE